MFNYFKPNSVEFNSEKPFPHFVLNNLWNNEILLEIEKEFNHFNDWDGQKNFINAKWKKFCGTYDKFPINTKNLIDVAISKEFINFLENVTGIKNLLPDHTFMGGGMHNTSNGGFLEMHADFNYNEKLGLYRRLNLLVYLNSNWEDDFGGFLEIEDKNKNFQKKIKPNINTTVLFVTDDDSIHGHPVPMSLPNNVTRKSIALYYYTLEKPNTGHYAKRNDTKYYSNKNENDSIIVRLTNFFKFNLFK